MAKQENKQSKIDHYHVWICDRGHTHADLRDRLFEAVSTTPLHPPAWTR